MSSIQRSPFPLLNAIQEQVQDSNVFRSIKFENNNTKFSSTYDLSFLGPFISLSVNHISCYHIFLPNFLILIDTSQPEKVLFLLATNQKPQYNFIFSTKDDAKKFYDSSLTIVEHLQPLIQNINLNFCKMNEELYTLLPNSTQISSSNVFVGFEKDNAGNHAILNVIPINDQKKAKKSIFGIFKQKENAFCLELKYSSEINVAQPTEIPKFLGENTFCKITTEVYQEENEKCLILCRTIDESLNLILSIYFLSHSHQDLNSQKFLETAKIPTVFLTPPKPSPSLIKSVDQESKQKVDFLSETQKEKQSKTPKNEIKPSSPTPQGKCMYRPDTIVIADDLYAFHEKNKNDNSLSNENEEVGDDFILEFEEVIVSNAKQNKISQRLIDYERSTRSRTNTLSKIGGSFRKRTTTIIRKGNINLNELINKNKKNDENEIELNYFTPSTTKSSDFDGNCEKSLNNVNEMIMSMEEERKKAQKNKSIENSLPDFKAFIKEMNQSKSAFVSEGDASINAQLDKAFEILKSNSYDDQFASIKQLNGQLEKNDEIVKKSIDFFSGFSLQTSEEKESDLFEFFDFSSFPSYDQEELKLSAQPHLDFIDKLAKINQTIEIKKITKLYSDTGGQKKEQVGQKLTALIAAIFLNGLRGFEKVNDISSREKELCNNLISSIRIISGSMSELEGIVGQMVNMVGSGDINNSGCDIATLASVLAALMLNEGILIQFLRTVQKNDDWVGRFYLPTSIIASSDIINMYIVLLTPIFCNVQFLLSIESAGSCLFNKKDSFIETLIKTPIQGFLEVDPFILLSMDQKPSISATPSSSGGISSISSMSSTSNLYIDLSNSKVVSNFRSSFQHAIVHQFQFGLKTGFIKISEKQRQFSFISDVSSSSSSLVSKGKNKQEWKEFVETTKFLKSTNGIMIKEMNRIEEWVSIGLEKKMLHTWLLFLGVNKDIVAKYYYPDSTFADPYRLKFVIKAILKFYKSIEQAKQNS